jgi:hypothetical protein
MLQLDVDDSQLQRLTGELRKVATPDESMMELIGFRMADIITEDNRKGVLEGFDHEDNPMPPLGYREGHGQPTAARASASDVFGTRRGRFKGVQAAPQRSRRGGPDNSSGILANNNLATWLYQEFDGPRLAPRGQSSRVIANLIASPLQVNGTTVVAECVWMDVVDENGRAFLMDHFGGSGHTPRYDLRGVRAWGIREAEQSALEWAQSLLEL